MKTEVSEQKWKMFDWTKSMQENLKKSKFKENYIT